MITIKFYAYMVYGPNCSKKDAFDALRQVSKATKVVSKIFNGVRFGTNVGVIQIDDCVRFNKLSDTALQSILRSYPYARVINSGLKC